MSILFQKEQAIIDDNWQRFNDVKARGHDHYIQKAKENNDFYLGGGRQWRKEDRDYLEALGRPAIEINGIFPAVNTAVGMQIKSRVDIAYKPRNDGADEETAETLSKVAMQICDSTHYPWIETQIFEDGLIQQRGYIDMRVSFGDNMQGNVEMTALDPLDVIPDPDANSYDPKDWSDVMILRWMTADDIADLYGQEKADLVNAMGGHDYGEADAEALDRSRFGDPDSVYGARYDYTSGDDGKRFLVIDRQIRKMQMEKVIVTASGDVFTKDELTPEQMNQLMKEGGIVSKRYRKRIKWVVSTADILLHNDWSPYSTFTVVPYFPYFRRGRTRGMVDNARSPQEILNKSISSYLHIIAGLANSGWKIPEGSLVNMTTDDLANHGSKTGLVIEHKDGKAPEKIQPSQPPTGVEKMVEKAEFAIKTCTGMSDAVQGLNGNEISGKALLTKQYQGYVQLAGPLDNLARTRHMVAMKLLEMIQSFYTEERVIMITDKQAVGKEEFVPLTLNDQQSDGSILNDVTIGEYDVIISDTPTSETFEHNQFEQAIAMLEKGIPIPPATVVEMSTLARKHDIAQQMIESSQPPPDPEAEAKAEERRANAHLKQAQAEKVKADTVNTAVDAQYSAMQAAGVIAQQPMTAPLADNLLRSAGYEDKNQPPIVPEYGTGYEGMTTEGIEDLPPNTDPSTPLPLQEAGFEAAPVPSATIQPLSADVGANAGIETQRID